MHNNPVVLAYYRHENSEVHHARHTAPSRCDTYNEANGDHAHKE